ncbi:MAG TPA: DUF4097 family beta strand repeat-containing protein [Spirochaetia bacterium]|nr:DUF4097 family beta strand repeat-containing protein [Spirochaetia bacterium]
MDRNRLGPLDILGITLGVIVILVVLGSIVMIARGRLIDPQGAFLGFRVPRDWQGDAMGFGSPVREEKDETVPAGATEIELRTVAGAIDVRGDPTASTVRLHSVRTAPFRRAMDEVQVDIRQEGGRLIAEEKHAPGFMNRTGTVSFQLVVPRGMKEIDAHSVSGSITVQGVEPGVTQNLSTISGGIATDRAGDLDASSTSGSIHFRCAGATVSIRTVSGSISGDLDSLATGGSAHFGSVSGSISVDASSGLDAELSLHSLSGRVSCDFPVTITEQKGNRLSGRIGKGSATVDAGTVSGSISISRM